MRPSDPEGFWDDPVGRYVFHPSFIYFCATGALWGCVVRGEVNEDVARAIATLLETGMDRKVRAHVSLVDLGAVTSIGDGAYGVLVELLERRGARVADHITRMAVVRPKGFAGAAVEGVRQIVSFPHPLALVDDVRQGLEWLREPSVSERSPRSARRSADADISVPELIAELEAMRTRLSADAPLLHKLRGLLESRPGRLSLAAAARKLGVSGRTLQRRLSTVGTSFQHEQNAAQIRVAKALLLETDAKLTAIASDVGWPSLQHFSTMFHRLTGEAPSKWRSVRQRQRR